MKERQGVSIDRYAIVDPKAELEDGVVIGPFTVVEGNVRIGKNTKIASNVLVVAGTTIGENCQVGHGSVLGTLPQYIGFNPDLKTTLEIGNNNIIREYCTFNRGTEHRGKTVVGSNCYLMSYAHVAHDCQVGNNIVMANAVNLAGHVTIEDFVGIGGMVPIHQFVRVGTQTFIGGGYRVTKDVPPYILASGEPLRFTGLNVIGLRRRGFSSTVREQIKHAYHILYREKLNVSQALEKIKSQMTPTPEVSAILKFVELSERGIIS
ncbi:acyl-ACP--UDP-N-acetylglucosamine O-acyltransferase [candidate division KSB1 bacterium]|nr:acyl-ACP--UDP-N-acetylglucosamine O-acyltransferase [candidate division KSB1 bacterium]